MDRSKDPGKERPKPPIDWVSGDDNYGSQLMERINAHKLCYHYSQDGLHECDLGYESDALDLDFDADFIMRSRQKFDSYFRRKRSKILVVPSKPRHFSLVSVAVQSPHKVKVDRIRFLCGFLCVFFCWAFMPLSTYSPHAEGTNYDARRNCICSFARQTI